MAAPERAAIAETHCAVVVFVGDRAYKLKKPVDLGFLDFSTVGARRQACEREVVLNRRLAPDVYLGVADVTGPDGELCDAVVLMRRMPAGRRLSTLVKSGVDVRPGLRSLARRWSPEVTGAHASPGPGGRGGVPGRSPDSGITHVRPSRPAAGPCRSGRDGPPRRGTSGSARGRSRRGVLEVHTVHMRRRDRERHRSRH